MIVLLHSLKYCVNTIVYDNHAAPWTISKYYGITIWYPHCAIVPSHLFCVKSCSLWNPPNSVKIGTLCWSLWHIYPMNTKHHWQKRGLGWKLPLRKCSMGSSRQLCTADASLCLATNRGRAALMGSTLILSSAISKAHESSENASYTRIHIHTCMHTQQSQRPPAECCVDMHKSLFSQEWHRSVLCIWWCAQENRRRK